MISLIYIMKLTLNVLGPLFVILWNLGKVSLHLHNILSHSVLR